MERTDNPNYYLIVKAVMTVCLFLDAYHKTKFSMPNEEIEDDNLLFWNENK